MALAYYSFKFTAMVNLPHDIASFEEAEVFIPDVKCVKIKGLPTSPELVHVEIDHDDGTLSSYDLD